MAMSCNCMGPPGDCPCLRARRGWTPTVDFIAYRTPFDGDLTASMLHQLAEMRRAQMQIVENDLRTIMGIRPEDV